LEGDNVSEDAGGGSEEVQEYAMERRKKPFERHALRKNNVFERNASLEGLGKGMCFEILELST
jgi:hypothetical protein